jgi:hypothetical protein
MESIIFALALDQSEIPVDRYNQNYHYNSVFILIFFICLWRDHPATAVFEAKKKAPNRAEGELDESMILMPGINL